MMDDRSEYTNKNSVYGSVDRFTLFPIKYYDPWNLYKKHVSSFWTVEEIDLTQDKKDWMTISPEERHYLSNILAFFVSADGIVGENLASRFYNDTDIPEVRCFYGFQLAMENIHAETYSLLLDTFITDSEEKDRLLNSISTIDIIGRKADWALKWINNTRSFMDRLIAFAVVEGVFFSGSFCSIFWFKKRGLFPGLSFSNEFISRDEALHCEFACLLYRLIKSGEIPHHKIRNYEGNIEEDEIKRIFKEAVSIEEDFIDYILPVEILDMNSSSMKRYIEYVADRLLLNLQCSKMFNVENPFPWMELISLQGKTNFFERRVSEYSKPMNVIKSVNDVFDPNALIQ
jgi:ribonucleotide reductase beta subunit family protein with ferritin-like domain